MTLEECLKFQGKVISVLLGCGLVGSWGDGRTTLESLLSK